MLSKDLDFPLPHPQPSSSSLSPLSSKSACHTEHTINKVPKEQISNPSLKPNPQDKREKNPGCILFFQDFCLELIHSLSCPFPAITVLMRLCLVFPLQRENQNRKCCWAESDRFLNEPLPLLEERIERRRIRETPQRRLSVNVGSVENRTALSQSML